MNTNSRLKKYSYVSISTAFMWLALLSTMIPKFTPVAIVTILIIMLFYATQTWCDSLENSFGAGLTLNYAMLLSVGEVFIMRTILRLPVKTYIFGLVATWVVFSFLPDLIMPKLYKGYSWIIFEYRHFGLRVNSDDCIESSDDRQDWGLIYAINILLFAVSSLPAILWEPLKEIIIKLYRDEIPFFSSLIVFINFSLFIIFMSNINVSKSKYEKIKDVNSALLICSVMSFSMICRNPLVLLAITAIVVVLLFKKTEVSIDKQLCQLLLYSDLPIMLSLLNMNRIYNISILGILFVGVMTIPLFYSALIIFALTTNYTKVLAIDEAVGYEEVDGKGYVEKPWSSKAFLIVYITKIAGIFSVEWLLFMFVKNHDAIADYIIKLGMSGWTLVIIGLYILVKILSLFLEKERQDRK